jgi:mono/diheme cytochrome c family protein
MTRALAIGVLSLGLVLGGCSRQDTPREAEADLHDAEPLELTARALEAAAETTVVARGRALIESYECNRCHRIEGIESPPLELDCAGCHAAIMAGRFEAPPDELAQWQGHLRSLLDVPTLAHTDRFRRAWVAEFLQSTHEIRPSLSASMPRLASSSDDAEALAAFLVPTAEPAMPAVGDVVRGREVLEAKGCATCHRFDGIPPLAAPPPPIELDAATFSRGARLAPDLRHARARLRPAALVQWLRDPASVKADSAMPHVPMTDQEIADAAAYLLAAPLDPATRPALPQRLPVLDRTVTHDEVDAQVFSQICRHCHASDDFIGGGGPGYAGGFGLPARKLDLSSYEGLLQGSVGDDGHRRSVFKPLDDGTPRLVAHLMARHAEVAGQPVEGIRGMPLGLPPLSLEQIQLVETWIAAGRPR